MAREEDLKRVDLKVSVNCCEGCRKKVLKALSIKGVLRTDIHPTLPKITVTGNVDVPTLIKRLAKSGKSAELWSNSDTCLPEKEKKPENLIKETSETNNDKGKVKAKDSDNRHEKSNSFSSNAHKISDKVKINENEGDAIKGNINNFSAEDAKGPYQTVVTTIPQGNSLVSPAMMQPYIQGFYPMQPNMINPVMMPYYAMNMNAYSAPPPCCIHDHCHCRSQVTNVPPPVHSQQATVFADYFNDENTVGCNVM